MLFRSGLAYVSAALNVTLCIAKGRVYVIRSTDELALGIVTLDIAIVSGPGLCKLGQPGVLFVLTEVPTPVFGPSFVLFSRAFPFLAV